MMARIVEYADYVELVSYSLFVFSAVSEKPAKRFLSNAESNRLVFLAS